MSSGRRLSGTLARQLHAGCSLEGTILLRVSRVELCGAQEQVQSNQQDLIEQMETNRQPYHAGHTKILHTITTHGSSACLGHSRHLELGEYSIGFGRPLTCRTAEITPASLTFIASLMLTPRLLRAAVQSISAVLPTDQPQLGVYLSTGMYVVRATPEHRVGEHHHRHQAG